MAFDTLEIDADASSHTGWPQDSTAPADGLNPRSRSWLASILGLQWREAGDRAVHQSPPVASLSHPTAPAGVSPETLVALRAEDAPVRLSMHGVLTAWRVAERALGELTEGSPEWAAVNATIISLRASYLARFDEYVAGSSR